MLRGVSFVSLRKRIRIRNSIVWEAQSSGCLPGTFFNAVLNSTLNNPLSWLCIPEPESQGITFERCKPCILVSSTFAFHVEGTQQIFDTKISPYGLAEDPFLICGWWPTTCLCSSLLQNLLFSWNLHFDLINDFLLHFNERGSLHFYQFQPSCLSLFSLVCRICVLILLSSQIPIWVILLLYLFPPLSGTFKFSFFIEGISAQLVYFSFTLKENLGV